METRYTIKKGKKNEVKIYFRFTDNGNTTTTSTGLKCKSFDWDKKGGRLLSHSHLKATRNILANYKNKIDAFIDNEIEKESQKPTMQELKTFCMNLVRGVSNDSSDISVSELLERYLFHCTEEKRLQPSTMIHIRLHLKDFEQVIGGTRIVGRDLTKEILNKYKNTLMRNGNQAKTVNNKTKNVKAFLNWLYKSDYTEKSLSKYLQREKEKKQKGIALRESEIIQLEKAVGLPDNLQRVVDVFLFMCYTAFDISTAKELTKDMIVDGTIFMTRVKTSQELEIPLIPEAIIILEKYDYELPFISDQKGNQLLKAAFKKIGLDRMIPRITKLPNTRPTKVFKPLHVVISWHVGRKTAITMALRKGMPIAVTMQLSGHADFKNMKPYIDLAKEDLANEISKTSRIANQEEE